MGNDKRLHYRRASHTGGCGRRRLPDRGETVKTECVACRVKLETRKQCDDCEDEAPFTVDAWEKATDPQVVLRLEKRVERLEQIIQEWSSGK